MNDRNSFAHDDLHDALADAYRHLAVEAPSGSTLTISRRQGVGRGRLSLVAAAAVAIIAIPTAVITLNQHGGGSSQASAASPMSSKTSPSAPPPTGPPTTVYPTPASSAPGKPVPVTPPPTGPPTTAYPTPASSAPGKPVPVTPPPTGPPTTVYPTPVTPDPGKSDVPITGQKAVKNVPRTPFAVGYLPAGYTFVSAQTSRSAAKGPGVNVNFGFGKAGTWAIFVSSHDFDSQLWSQDGQMKPTTVNGHPAMAMDGMVAIKVGSYLVLVSSKSVAPVALLRAVAEGLTFASDPDTQSTWFDTVTAIPGT